MRLPIPALRFFPVVSDGALRGSPCHFKQTEQARAEEVEGWEWVSDPRKYGT
jgi:hypothetical protein